MQCAGSAPNRQLTGDIVMPSSLKPVSSAVALLISAACAPHAAALTFDTDVQDLKIQLDTSVKYSLGYRTASGDPAYAADPNTDDGNRNLRSGPISNRLDLLSELDISRRGLGARLSAAAWYDHVYMSKNDNNSPGTLNAPVSDPRRFSDHVRDLHGRRAEVLDAFVFASHRFGNDVRISARLGQHALLMGESVFFGDNGVAAANAPIDILKSVTVPSLQAKEVIIPTKQLSWQIQPVDNVSLIGYYQFEWKRNRAPLPASYFSGTDFGPGADEGDVFFAPPPLTEALGAPPGSVFATGPAVKPRDSGQFALALKYRLPSGAAEFGLYAARYHSKDVLPIGGDASTPFYFRPGAGVPNPSDPRQIGTVNFIFPQSIRVYGFSANTNIGDANVGFEVSTRRNTPLASTAVFDAPLPPGPPGSPPPPPYVPFDNDANPGYAIGTSTHAQVSMLYVSGPSALWNSATFVAEIAGHRRGKVTRNEAQLDTTANRSSWGFRFLLEPQYLQVLPGLDIAVPLSVGYIPEGRSSVVTNFGGGFNKGGSASIGVNATYQARHKFGFNYVQFIGKTGNGNPPVMDRDNISIYAQTSF
jgi:hypothetical protein